MTGDIHIFVPSYHRPDNIKTALCFKKVGWDMSKVHIFIDSETDDKEQYAAACAKFGCNLHIFDMDEARARYDYVHRGSPSLRSAGQARNMFQDFAQANGIDFYCVQDDDTPHMDIRSPYSPHRTANGKDIRLVFSEVEQFMRKRHIGVFAIPQNGDYMAGVAKFSQKLYRRKVMNCTFYLLPYIYRGERGVQDDDTSMFCGILNAGLFTGSAVTGLSLQQMQSAKQKGGLTDLYNECKLLNKALVCPIQWPSAVYAQKQVMNGNRIHHRIEYRYLSPCVMKGTPDRDNIAWDKYPEDSPFTQEALCQGWRSIARQPNVSIMS